MDEIEELARDLVNKSMVPRQADLTHAMAVRDVIRARPDYNRLHRAQTAASRGDPREY